MPNDSTQPDIPQLKPCPFCGGKPKTQRNRAGGLHIFCDENYCVDPDGEGEHDGQDEDIIRLWNARPLVARLETQLASVTAEKVKLALELAHYKVKPLVEKENQLGDGSERNFRLDAK